MTVGACAGDFRWDSRRPTWVPRWRHSSDMNAAVANAAPIASVCHHCGEALPVDAVLDGAYTYCCNGCAAASAWIGQAALDDYYRLRNTPAGRVDADPADFSAWDRDLVLAEHSRAIPGGREITVLTD